MVPSSIPGLRSTRRASALASAIALLLAFVMAFGPAVTGACDGRPDRAADLHHPSSHAAHHEVPQPAPDAPDDSGPCVLMLACSIAAVPSAAWHDGDPIRHASIPTDRLPTLASVSRTPEPPPPRG